MAVVNAKIANRIPFSEVLWLVVVPKRLLIVCGETIGLSFFLLFFFFGNLKRISACEEIEFQLVALAFITGGYVVAALSSRRLSQTKHNRYIASVSKHEYK